ncbi:MAG: class I SAM-dependent methyltransferase [Gammaproteobacteria bacterium]
MSFQRRQRSAVVFEQEDTLSRLDSFVRRLQAQKACLEQAAVLIQTVSGPVLELGLGNGRTYDHLRELLPDREIFVFERRVSAHAACIPDEAHLILGDVSDTLPAAGERIATPAALAHIDCGTDDAERNAALALEIAHKLAPLMGRGGVVVSDQRMSHQDWEPLALPEGVAEGRYYMYCCNVPG